MKLQEGETILHTLEPESRVLGIWLFSKVVGAAFVAAFLTFWCIAFFGGIFAGTTQSDGNWILRTGLTLAVMVGVAMIPFGVIYCVYLRRTYTYYITNQRCVFHGGLIRRVKRSVPYHKVTDVEQSQNIVERILGISTIKIFTPGTASMSYAPFRGQRAELNFVGLHDPETPALTINEQVRKVRSGPHD